MNSTTTAKTLSVPFWGEEDMVFLISRLGAATRGRLSDALSAHHLSPRQFVVLRLLRTDNGLSQTELSKRLGIDTSSIVHLIDECEKAGLVSRKRRTDDRRRYAIELTALGHTTFEQAQDQVDKFQQKLLAPLGAADRATLRRLLVSLAGAGDVSLNDRAGGVDVG